MLSTTIHRNVFVSNQVCQAAARCFGVARPTWRVGRPHLAQHRRRAQSIEETAAAEVPKRTDTDPVPEKKPTTFNVKRPPPGVPPPKDYGKMRDSGLAPYILSIFLLFPLFMIVLPFLPKV